MTLSPSAEEEAEAEAAADAEAEAEAEAEAAAEEAAADAEAEAGSEAEADEVAALEAQPVSRASVRTSASAIARIFFMVLFSLKFQNLCDSKAFG